MPSSVELVKYPELIFGVAGPIGVDIDEITTSLDNALKGVKYSSVIIKLTDVMVDYPVDTAKPEQKDLYHLMSYKMDYANALCKKYNSAEALAAIAIHEIVETRKELTKDKPGTIPERTAYIVRQLKRPEEVTLLRRVYGRQFVLVSAYGSLQDRKRRIEAKLRNSLVPPNEVERKADDLISRDVSEQGALGQQLRETFHLADVFIDGIDRREMDRKLGRFVQAFFGRNDIAPSKDEYGMYAAKSAALRSSDLSRQVGAAIFSSDGELVTQGCNEVPKSFGGTYWDQEDPDFRDVRLGYDPNELLKKELLRDLFERLSEKGLLSEKALGYGSPSHMVEAVTRKAKPSDGPDAEDGALVGASVMDLTEYGRVVHAEMCAICDAARLGRSVKKATLYCTTFPCHNCTKHIIASGIRRVVYMEPYPKSKAKDLHENEIEIEKENADKVAFVPFLGISPFRYRDIFQKGKRKTSEGAARRWYANHDEAQPMLEIVVAAYEDAEEAAISPLLGELRQPSSDTEAASSLPPRQ